jgi:hypothetical protein
MLGLGGAALPRWAPNAETPLDTEAHLESLVLLMPHYLARFDEGNNIAVGMFHTVL